MTLPISIIKTPGYHIAEVDDGREDWMRKGVRGL